MSDTVLGRAIEAREARISRLEAEVQRLGNIITDQADTIARQHAALLQIWCATPRTPKPVHPSKIKTLPLSIGILEGHGGSER